MPYPGGKNGAGVYQRLICMMPPHQAYVEPFLGGGTILKLKRPAPLNIAMDLHAPAVKAFLELALAEVKSSAEAAAPDDTTRSGNDCRRAPSSAAILPAAAPKLRIFNRDGLVFLENLPPDLANGATLVYCDPPYLHSTRSTKSVVNGWKARQTENGWNGLYQHEMSDVDHGRLLRWAIATPCRVMISGYESEMYLQALAGWRCSRFQAMTRGGLAEECVWANFPEPTELHDYRYLGEGFRERERIKRKKKRWLGKLERMAPLERLCLMSAIADTAHSSDAVPAK
jgi:hypothetical protein